jgi:hypothetical protein
MKTIRLPTWYYKQFDADFEREIPAEGFGGWDVANLPLSIEHTAFVLMHAWDCSTREEYPGWHRMVEYIPRADAICRDVLPGLLCAIRTAGMPLYHIVTDVPSHYYKTLPGYKRSVEIAEPPPPPVSQVLADEVSSELRQFMHDRSCPGAHNQPDIDLGFASMSFPPQALPLANEPIAENGRQLSAVCREKGINHLIYAGFAINWCLLLSPGGMAEMSRYGILCSAIRQAVTAVENRESARGELHKEEGLWRTSLSFGFVYDVQDIISALTAITLL